MADENDGIVEIMEVDNLENEPSTSKAANSTQPTEIKKRHYNLPW
jgi:hypothetical protein